MFDAQVWTFLGVALVLTITPGADTMLVLRNVLTGGQRAGFLATIGICSGLLVHAVGSALGLSLIIVQSALAFEVVKLTGAAYLIFLGCQSLWHSLGKPANVPGKLSRPARAVSTKSTRQWLLEGLLSNVLNPKVSVFYLAFLPQFIQPGDPLLAKTMLLAGLHLGMGIIWLVLVTILAGQIRAMLGQPPVQRGIEMFAGGVLVLFGVRLALERR